MNNISSDSNFSSLFKSPLSPNQLNEMCHPKFGRVLRLEEDGRLSEVNILKALGEKIRTAIFREIDYTDKTIIEYRVIKFLEDGLNKNLLNEADLPLTKGLAKRIGLNLDRHESINKHKYLASALEKFNSSLSQENQNIAQSFYKSRKEDLLKYQKFIDQKDKTETAVAHIFLENTSKKEPTSPPSPLVQNKDTQENLITQTDQKDTKKQTLVPENFTKEIQPSFPQRNEIPQNQDNEIIQSLDETSALTLPENVEVPQSDQNEEPFELNEEPIKQNVTDDYEEIEEEVVEERENAHWFKPLFTLSLLTTGAISGYSIAVPLFENMQGTNQSLFQFDNASREHQFCKLFEKPQLPLKQEASLTSKVSDEFTSSENLANPKISDILNVNPDLLKPPEIKTAVEEEQVETVKNEPNEKIQQDADRSSLRALASVIGLATGFIFAGYKVYKYGYNVYKTLTRTIRRVDIPPIPESNLINDILNKDRQAALDENRDYGTLEYDELQRLNEAMDKNSLAEKDLEEKLPALYNTLLKLEIDGDERIHKAREIFRDLTRWLFDKLKNPNQAAFDELQRLHNAMETNSLDEKDLETKLPALHITLLKLEIDGDERIHKAKNIFHNLTQWLFDKLKNNANGILEYDELQRLHNAMETNSLDEKDLEKELPALYITLLKLEIDGDERIHEARNIFHNLTRCLFDKLKNNANLTQEELQTIKENFEAIAKEAKEAFQKMKAITILNYDKITAVKIKKSLEDMRDIRQKLPLYLSQIRQICENYQKAKKYIPAIERDYGNGFEPLHPEDMEPHIKEYLDKLEENLDQIGYFLYVGADNLNSSERAFTFSMNNISEELLKESLKVEIAPKEDEETKPNPDVNLSTLSLEEDKEQPNPTLDIDLIE